jgi:hypothetical protein
MIQPVLEEIRRASETIFLPEKELAKLMET